MAAWRKSSFSYSNGGCIEAASWRKSSRSMGVGECIEAASWRTSSRSHANGNCAEVGQGAAVVGVRDSKDPGGPVLEFPRAAWAAFTARLRA